MIDERIIAAAPWRSATDFIVLAQAGSHAHGTVIPSTGIDDVDYLGAYWPPLNLILGMERQDNWVWKAEELDVTCYSLEKLIRLLAKANPNVMGLLWMPAEKIVYRSSAYDHLLCNRHLFVAKHPVYAASIGYARDQLNKMTKAQAYQGYMGAKRRLLVNQFGYDPKNATHLIRLLVMAIEFMEFGEFYVDRAGIDAEYLKAIKRGDYSLQAIQAEASALFRQAEVAYQRSKLPERMDRNAIDDLLTDMQRAHICHPNRLPCMPT